MQFFTKAIALGAFAGVVAAQSTVLTFDTVPNPITDGKATAITYSTNDTVNPVTIILESGPSTNLKVIQTLTTSATGGQFIWTPDTSLADGTDYALTIKQEGQTNYFGPFTIQGASSSAVSSASSSTSAHGSTVVQSSITASGTTSVANVTNPAPEPTTYSSANASMTALTASSLGGVGTVGTVGTAGTGTVMSRNTTMSSATLSSSAGSSSAGSSSAGSPATTSAGATSGAGFSSATGSAAASSSTSGASSFQASSPIALVFGAMAAIFYLQ